MTDDFYTHHIYENVYYVYWDRGDIKVRKGFLLRNYVFVPYDQPNKRYTGYRSRVHGGTRTICYSEEEIPNAIRDIKEHRAKYLAQKVEDGKKARQRQKEELSYAPSDWSQKLIKNITISH